MKSRYIALLTLVLLPLSVYGQSGSINNTLGSGTLFSLSRTSGYLILPATTGSTVGVIYSGGNSFIHDYQPSGTLGGNTFVGVNSGNFTTTAYGPGADCNNTAVGYYTMPALTNGVGNSAFGSEALYHEQGGPNNCAFGASSLSGNTSGGQNSAFGQASLSVNSTGSYNSAFGSSALNGATGSNNSAFGENAGSNIQNGSDNSCIGYNAQASSSSVSDEFTLGDGNITALRCQVTSITALSDARDKKNIRDLTLGLDFLMKVKPRLFNWDRRDWYAKGKPDGSKMQVKPTAGFVAQELDQVQTKENAEYLNLVMKSNANRLEATPGNLLPIMVKAIQDLKGENDALKKELIALRASIAEVKKEVATARQENAKPKVSVNQTKD